MSSLTYRLPLINRGDRLIATVIGHPSVEVGDEVLVSTFRSASEVRTIGGLIVTAIHSGEPDALPEGVLHMLGVRETSALLDALSFAYGTRFPVSAPVRIYELAAEPLASTLVASGAAPHEVDGTANEEEKPKRRRRRKSSAA